MSKAIVVTPWTQEAFLQAIEKAKPQYGSPLFLTTDEKLISRTDTWETTERFLNGLKNPARTVNRAFSSESTLPFEFAFIEFLSPSGNSKSYLLFCSSVMFQV
jgi:hypothetical protein